MLNHRTIHYIQMSLSCVGRKTDSMTQSLSSRTYFSTSFTYCILHYSIIILRSSIADDRGSLRLLQLNFHKKTYFMFPIIFFLTSHLLLFTMSVIMTKMNCVRSILRVPKNPETVKYCRSLMVWNINSFCFLVGGGANMFSPFWNYVRGRGLLSVAQLVTPI